VVWEAINPKNNGEKGGASKNVTKRVRLVTFLLIEPFFLNFFSWGASVAGQSFGTIGFAMYLRTKRDD